MEATLAVARLIGWMLIHSLWQGLLLGLAYGAGRAVVARGQARYRLGLAAMVSLVLMQGATLALLWREAEPPALGGELAPWMAMPATQGALAGSARLFSWSGGFDAALPWMALAWSGGVLLLASRAGWQWLGLRQLVRSAQASPSWQQRLDRIAIPFGLAGRVRILCSDAVASPILIGLVRPVILLPIAVACEMPVTQVELVLAHELAHVRRLDPLVNLLQVVIETFYFHHPAVRWISREIRNEREVCSDAMALSGHPGSRREYIQALATLGEWRGQRPVILASNGGLLFERVQLIAAPQRVAAEHGAPARLAAMCLGLVLVLVTVSREWSLAIPRISWPQGASASMGTAVDRLLHPPAWHFADLAPHRTAAAYPRVALPGNRIPDIPGPAIGSRSALPDVGTVVAPLALAGLANGVLPSPHQQQVDALPALPALPTPPARTAAEPTPVHVQQPVYPPRALDEGTEGAVVIEFSIDRQGRVGNMRVIRSEPEGVFDQAALTALRDWRYATPAEPATARFRQTISFILHDPASRGSDAHEAAEAAPCTVLTGTHICRFPEGTRPAPRS